MPGSAQIGNLSVNLSLETAAFSTGAAKAKAQANGLKGSLAGLGTTMKSFAGGLVGGLGIGLAASALGGLAANAVQAGADLAEASEKVGVSVEALQELRLAADQTGVSQESLAGAMAKLNRALGDLQMGKKSAVDAFAAIGLSADDLKGKSADQALRLVADALNKLPDVQQRVAIGAQIMGRGFSELLPLISGGSKALDEYAQKSREQGQISTESAKKLDDLADHWSAFKISAGVAAANTIASAIGMHDKVNAALKGLTDWAGRTDAAIANMARNAVSFVNNMVTGITTAITGKLNAVWEGAKAKIESVTTAFKNMWDRVVGHSYVPDMVDGISEHFGRLDGEMVDPALSATQQVMEAFRGIQENAFGGFADALTDVIMGARNLKDAFTDLAKSVIADILRMTLRMLVFRAVSGMFGGGIGGPDLSSGTGVNIGATPLPSMPVKFAKGGSGVFGGFGGVDRNILSMNGSPIARVSRGEHFSVTPANNNGGRIVVELRDEMLNARIADGANVQIVRAAPIIQSSAVRAVNERNRRA